MSRERDLVRLTAAALEAKALETLADGMVLSRRSGRLDVISKLATDDECKMVLQALLDEGLVVIVDDLPALTSKGGTS